MRQILRSLRMWKKRQPEPICLPSSLLEASCLRELEHNFREERITIVSFSLSPSQWPEIQHQLPSQILYAEDMALTLADWFLPHYNALEQHQDIVLSKFGKQKLPSPKTVILFASIWFSVGGGVHSPYITSCSKTNLRSPSRTHTYMITSNISEPSYNSWPPW